MKWFKMITDMSAKIHECDFVKKYSKRPTSWSSENRPLQKTSPTNKIIKASIAIVVIILVVSVLASIENRQDPDAIIDNARCYEITKKLKSFKVYKGEQWPKAEIFKVVKSMDFTNADADLIAADKTNPKILQMIKDLDLILIQDQVKALMNLKLF